MSISIVNSLPEEEWRRYVDQHPAGNVFHTPEMYQVFQQAKGYSPEIWAALGAEQQILALLLPVRISLNAGLFRALTTRSIVFGGVLVSDRPEGSEALILLLKAYQQENRSQSLFTEIRNVSSCLEYQPILSRSQFSYEAHLNYLIDLGPSPEEVFNRIGRRTQRNIRHGLNQAKVAIEEVNDCSGLNESYTLLSKTYHTAQVPLADRSLFESALDRLAPKGMILATTATVEAAPAATSFELLYKDIIFGWYGGMDRAYGAFVPNELLMWHILRQGSERGYRQYDFGGAGKPHEDYGVRDFKAKFGGNLVCYGRNTWVPHKALLRFCKIGYEAYRRFLAVEDEGNGD